MFCFIQMLSLRKHLFIILTQFKTISLWSCYSIALQLSSVKSLRGVSLYQYEKMTLHALGIPVGIISSVFSLSCKLKDKEVRAIVCLHIQNRNCTTAF